MQFKLLQDENTIQNLLKNLKGILVDFDGTLTDYEKSSTLALEEFFKQYLPAESIPIAIEEYHKINSELWKKFEKQEITLDEVRITRFKAMVERYNIKEKPQRLDKEYLDFLIAHTHIEDQIIESLRQLKQKGLKILIITNGIHYVQSEKIKKTGLNTVIDGYLTSEQIGNSKPHAKMFYQALEQIKCKNTETLVIGDTISSDIKGASNADINSILVSSNYDVEFCEDIAIKPLAISKNFIAISNYILSII